MKAENRNVGTSKESLYSWLRLSVSSVIMMVVLAAGASAQGGQTAFVFLVGSDTLGVERFSTGSNLVTGEVLMRGQPRMTYLAMVAAPGRFGSIELAVYANNSSPDAQPSRRVQMRLVGDTVFADITAGGTAGSATQTQKLPTKAEAFILLNSSVAMFETALARLGAQQDSASFPVLLSAGGQTITATFRRVTRDSIRLQLGPQESHLIVRGTQIVRARTPAQGLVVERVEGAAAARISLGKPDYSAPANAPYRAEQVTLPTSSGHTLAGTLTMPSAPGRRVPAVVTVTGSGPQDRDEYISLVAGYRPFRQVADTLARRGIAVLRYDDRGTGESTGDFGAATSADFADDVRAAIAWLRARPDIDPAKIVVLGHSEGGLIAPLVAASDPRLAGIVLMAGPSKGGREIINFQIRYGVDHDSAVAPAKRDSTFGARMAAFDSAAAQQPWMKFFLAYDPMPTIRQVKSPVLILQGATDQQVTADQAEALGAALRQAGNRDVTVRVFPDRNHLFLPDPIGNPAGYTRAASGRIGPEVMGEIAEWLVAKMR
ncbi:MAG: alpha/beta hydrolase family protein [Longimicrobiales bacterium]